MEQDHFDRLFAEGSRDVLSGQHVVDVPAPALSQRWGPSVCLRPCTDIAERLSGLTAASMEYAGQGHWPTGSTLSSHFTVRVLDHFRDGLHPENPAVLRYLDAITRASSRAGPIRLRVTGLTLTRTSVMATATPVDSAADDFASALAGELGADGWYEAEFDKPFWYSNLVHFTGPIASPRGLVDWVQQRRSLDVGVALTGVALLGWRYDGRQMLPVRLGGVP